MPATAIVQGPVGPAKSVTLRTTDDLIAAQDCRHALRHQWVVFELPDLAAVGAGSGSAYGLTRSCRHFRRPAHTISTEV